MQVFFQIQRAHALRTVDFVRGHGIEVDILKVERALEKSLYAVAMHHAVRVVRLSEPGKF